jgi:hypothetical protein
MVVIRRQLNSSVRHRRVSSDRMVPRLRLILVGLTLIGAGALLGALCGLVAVVPLGLQQWLRPTPDDGFVSPGDVAPYLAAVGAVCGAALVPILAFGMLRAVPVWRVCTALFLGAVGGTLAAWTAAFAGASFGGPEMVRGGRRPRRPGRRAVAAPPAPSSWRSRCLTNR